MKDHPYDPAPAVEAWLKEPIWLPESDLGRVAQLVHQTPQQRGWRPALDRERYQAMFSATKLVVAGIIVAAFGSFFLASGVFSPPPVDQVPAMTATPTETAVQSSSPSATDSPAPPSPPRDDLGTTAWGASVLPQTEEIAALVTGVAVGPELMVAVGQRACERTKNEDLGRCWGQPWVSTDGVSWEAVEARTSGLDLGRFIAATSGPEIGVEGVTSGPGGFVAFGWARPVGGGRRWGSSRRHSGARLMAGPGNACRLPRVSRPRGSCSRARGCTPSPAPMTATSWAARSTPRRHPGQPSGRAPTG